MASTKTTKLFADKLQELIADSGKNMKELAAEIGISAAALSKYQNDGAAANIDALVKIAKYFDVTTDWLLGYGEIKRPDPDKIMAHKYTGLSDSALETIARLPLAEKDMLSAVICLFNLDAILRHLLEIGDCAEQLNRELQGKGGLYKISLEKGWITPESSLVDDDSLIDRYSELRLSRFEAIDLFTRELDFLFNIQQLQEQYFESAYPRLDDVADERNKTASGAGDAESGQ